VPGGVPWTELPLLVQAEPGNLHHLMYGTFAGQPAQAFDLDLFAYRQETGAPKRSCVLFRVDGSFPLLTVSPHTRLSLVEERDRSPFTQKYRVLGRDPEVAKLVLDPPMRDWLLGIERPVHFELGGSYLLGHIAQDPDAWADLFQLVFGFFIRLPDEALERYGRHLA
jgi:hypothetical protein